MNQELTQEIRKAVLEACGFTQRYEDEPAYYEAGNDEATLIVDGFDPNFCFAHIIPEAQKRGWHPFFRYAKLNDGFECGFVNDDNYEYAQFFLDIQQSAGYFALAFYSLITNTKEQQ